MRLLRWRIVRGTEYHVAPPPRRRPGGSALDRLGAIA